MRVSMRGLRRLNQRHREITRKNVSGLSYVSRYPILVSSRERIGSGSECLGRLGNIGEREREEREGYPGNEHAQTSHRCVSYTCIKLTEAWLGDTRFAGNAL